MNLSAREQVEQIRSGKLTAEELMSSTLTRIKEVNGKVNAIVSLRDEDEIMTEARQADKQANKGPLHGLPLAIKDLANAKGLPTSMGSPAFAGQIAESDDLFVARMREAGAIIIGKTNTPEFGLGSNTYNPVHGITHNPYNLDVSCGGSSGGAAVALATGMLSIADGSDMMGSLRNPAGWNNVFGMRPSWGLVPSEPVGDTFLHQLATNGPMARSPDDMALLLDVMSGPDSRQPHGLPQTSFGRITPDAKGKRIGWLKDWGGALPYEEGIVETCEQALATLGEIGCEIELLPPPFPREHIWESWQKLRSWNVAAKLAPLMENQQTRGQLKPEALWEIENGLSLSAMDVHAASVLRSQWYSRAAELFEKYDALAIPSAQIWPFPVDQTWPREVAGQQMDTYHRWMECVIPVSLIGLPAIAVPAGFGSNKLPAGLQLVGKHGDDHNLLKLAQAYHEVTNWPDKNPPNLS